MNLNKYFDYAKSKGFSDVEIKYITNNSVNLKIFHGKIENYVDANNSVFAIRGIINGNMVSGYTENKDSIYNIIDTMALNGLLIEEKKEQEIYAGSDKYKRGIKRVNKLKSIPVLTKIDKCLEIEKKCFAYSNKISEVSGVSYFEVERSVILANSNGLKLSRKEIYGGIHVSVVAKDGDDVKVWYGSQLFEDFEKIDEDKMVKNACDNAINALHASPCVSKKYKTILDADVFANFISILLSSVSGEQVNKGTSLLKDKLHTQIASKKFTLIEDPLSKKYPYLYTNFDDEGVATYKKAIVEKGVLNTFLYNLESAKKAKTTTTGNGYGGASIGTNCAFLQVKPGNKSLEQLALKVKNGIYINDVAGLHAGVNRISGNFSLQANGYLIKDGKIDRPVNLITIAGNVFDLFKDIVELGNDVRLINGSIDTPCVFIKSLAISGK